MTSSKEETRFPHEVQRKIVSKAYTHITQVPLPEVWTKLPEAFNGWLNVPEKDVKEIEEICQIYQYGDVILDDIQNDRNSRDGIQTGNAKYGLAEAINSHMFCYTEFGARLREFSSDKMARIVRKDVTIETCKSRATRLYWRDAFVCPTEDEYYEMIIQQTYLFLTAKIKLMQLSSKNKQDFLKLCALFGLYFQILHDFRRLSATFEQAGELYCEDITLGKYSLPIIHAIRTQPEAAQVITDIYRLRSKEKTLKDYVLSLLEKFGSFQYTKTVLEQLRQEIVNEAKKLGTNTRIEKFMEAYLKPSLAPDAGPVAPSTIISSFMARIDEPQAKDVNELQIKRVLRPAMHFESLSLNSVGKLILAIKAFAKMPDEKLGVIKYVLATMLAPSFIIDDIQDSSELRRGVPCAHHIFGVANSLNASFYLLARIVEKLVGLGELEAIDMYESQFRRMVQGQGMDIYWRDNMICPTEGEYIDMMVGKTNGIFLLIGKLSTLYSSNGKNYENLMGNLGKYSQIMDDYHNLTNECYFAKKGFCEDLSEGKFSFPIVHAIHTHPKEGQLIMDILRKRTYDVEIKKYCLSLLEKCGSFDYTRKKIKEVREVVVQEFTNCGASVVLLDLLDKKIELCDI